MYNHFIIVVFRFSKLPKNNIFQYSIVSDIEPALINTPTLSVGVVAA